jgi:4-amino-4-deoxy-L-arabinose transferase-like glycosyltransferase
MNISTFSKLADKDHVPWKVMLGIVVLGLVAYLPFLGAAPLFDWDEINFAESAREMIVSGNYFQVLVNFEPFWEKPPLFIWMQVLAMKAFGINEFAARLPNAIIGVFTLLFLCRAGTQLRNLHFGLLVSAFYFVSILPHLYFKSGIIDPSFNLFIFMGLFQILSYEQGRLGDGPKKGMSAPALAGTWIGLATLTKGPVALLVLMLSYFIYKAIFDRKLPYKAILVFIAVYLGVILTWFGSLVAFTPEGIETVRKFIVYQVELFLTPVAGHEQPFFYHFVVFAIGCFPLSAFAFRGMFMKVDLPKDQVAKRMMVVLFWVVLILFTIVRTKIIHYSSLLYFPGAFLAAFWMYELIKGKSKLKWDNYLLYSLGFVVFGCGSMLIGIVAANIEWLEGSATGIFAKAVLATKVQWTGWEFLPGLLFFLSTLFAGFLLLKKRYTAALLLHVCIMPIYANGINALILPRIADYTQNPAIRFFKEKSKEDAYMMVEGYKSYAHYFYAQTKPFPHPEIPLEQRGDWMARGEVDQPVYLVTRIDRLTDEFEHVWFEKFHRIGAEAGFVFFRREPVLTQPIGLPK